MLSAKLVPRVSLLPSPLEREEKRLAPGTFHHTLIVVSLNRGVQFVLFVTEQYRSMKEWKMVNFKLGETNVKMK